MNHKSMFRKQDVFRFFSVFLPLFLIFSAVLPVQTVRADEGGMASPPSIMSMAAVVMDAETGQVLYEKAMDKQMAPASITKIISAIVALESGVPLDETITMSYDAVFSVPRYSSHIALDEGEELSMEDALYAMMLASANDAANGIAETVSGSNEKFVEQMNILAQDVGATNTHFTNPHGLIDSEHYTTAYDMALLTRYAIQNEDFVRIFSTITYEMEPTNKQPEQRIFSNQNEMVKNTAYKYEGAVGGKLGYTEEALYTIVTVAERDGRTLICVCLRSDPYVQQYSDAAAVLDFAFDNYHKVEMTADALSVRNISFALEEGQKTAATASILTTEESVYYLPNGLSEADYTTTFNYTESGNKMDGFAPKAIITLNNPPSGVPAVIEVPLSSTITAAAQMQDVPKEEPQEEKKASGILTVILNVVKWIVIVVLFLIVLILAIRTWNLYNRRKRRKQRMERQRRQAQRSGTTPRQYRNDVNVSRRKQNSSRTRSKIDIPIDRDSRY